MRDGAGKIPALIRRLSVEREKPHATSTSVVLRSFGLPVLASMTREVIAPSGPALALSWHRLLGGGPIP
jgi:hypothetical protein